MVRLNHPAAADETFFFSSIIGHHGLRKQLWVRELSSPAIPHSAASHGSLCFLLLASSHQSVAVIETFGTVWICCSGEAWAGCITSILHGGSCVGLGHIEPSFNILTGVSVHMSPSYESHIKGVEGLAVFDNVKR